MAKDTFFGTEYPDNEEQIVEEQTPVTIFGITFNNDDERREYFRKELRKKLPELKKIEGFPIGEDDDIIKLSDPPYYTACPNPWLNSFIKEWEEEKKTLISHNKRVSSFKVVEPYADDITGVKNDSVYRSLVYHTKVPQEIIMKFLFYYTQPGDIVLDGFGGTGMTGLACQSCNNPPDDLKKKVYSKNIEWGGRHCICGDISSYASTISYNVNTPIKSKEVEKEVNRIYNEMEEEFGWMYKTKHSDGNDADIICTIYSDIVTCPHCQDQFILWDYTVDKTNKKLLSSFKCPSCSSIIETDKVQKAIETYYDEKINKAIKRKKTIPVRVIYKYKNKRYEKNATSDDIELIKKIENFDVSDLWFPTSPMMGVGERWGDTWRSGVHTGMTHVHHFYTRRNLIFLAEFYKKINQSPFANKLLYIFSSMILRSTIMNRVHFAKYLSGKTDWDAGHMKGTMYVPSYSVETSVLAQIKNKLKRFTKAAPYLPQQFDNAIMIASANANGIMDNSIDYIFVDPPFGENIMYSELNYISESWLKVTTNNCAEAIEDTTHNKDHTFYFNKMYDCFSEFYRVLKPGKWMTVEFSNTSAAVWNAIQLAISKAGFMIANVAVLNKGQGGMRAVSSPTAVKEDLAISCYKPSSDIRNINCSPEIALWDFVEEHISHLTKYASSNGQTKFIQERDPRIIYGRVISHYVQNGLEVPIDATTFLKQISKHFKERDGMIFTAAQVAEYDEKKQKSPEFVPLGIIVFDETSGIEWLKNKLRDHPQKRQDILSDWRMAIADARKGDIIPELDELLEENFIRNDDGSWRLPNINDDVDLEALRTKALLKEFNIYLDVCNNPRGILGDVRAEAVLAGFRQCYNAKNFGEIKLIGDRINQDLLRQDPYLLQYYQAACRRIK